MSPTPGRDFCAGVLGEHDGADDGDNRWRVGRPSFDRPPRGVLDVLTAVSGDVVRLPLR